MRRAPWLVLLMASSALAQAPHREGEYGGVNPTGEARPADKPAKAKKPPPRGTLAWIGFEAKDGGAQVFLQSAAPFEVTQRVEGATLVVSTDLTRHAANTWRPIDTRFFDNPLARITAGKAKKTKKRGIELRITFKNPRDVREGSVRTETGPDGMHYVYLTFPEGTEPAGTATPSSDPER